MNRDSLTYTQKSIVFIARSLTNTSLPDMAVNRCYRQSTGHASGASFWTPESASSLHISSSDTLSPYRCAACEILLFKDSRASRWVNKGQIGRGLSAIILKFDFLGMSKLCAMCVCGSFDLRLHNWLLLDDALCYCLRNYTNLSKGWD